MQCACAIISSVSCPAVQYFSTLSRKWHDFRGKNVIERKMCVSILFRTFVCNISHSKKKWARYDKKSIFMYSTSYSCQILMKLDFLNIYIFLKNTQISNFTTVRPVGAELFHAEWRTDRGIYIYIYIYEEANSHFTKFCEGG